MACLKNIDKKWWHINHEKSQQFRQLLELSTIEKTTLHGTQLLLERSQLSLLKEKLDLEITIDTLEDAYN